MTAVAPKPITARPYPARQAPKGSVFLKMIRTTDPKDIAILYLVASFAFFMAGGAMALLMRAELAQPGLQVVSTGTYNALFTMHGSTMIYLFVAPFALALGLYLVPLQIGAAGLAGPRWAHAAWWLYALGR